MKTKRYQVTLYDGKEIHTQSYDDIREVRAIAAGSYDVVIAPCLGIFKCNRPGNRRPGKVPARPRLGPKRLRTLMALMLNPGVYLNLNEIAELTGDEQVRVSPEVLASHLYQARLFLCDDPENPIYMGTQKVAGTAHCWLSDATWLLVDPVLGQAFITVPERKAV